METGDPLVSAKWLLENIDAPDLRVVDASWVPPFLTDRKSGKQGYDEAHIPGAVYFDIDAIADQSSDLPHMLPDAVVFSSRVRQLGLGDGNRVIVYDHNGFYASARVWWMFRAMGHRDVKVLDGGLNAWTEAGGDTEDLPPVSVERHFTAARKRADLVRDKAQMRELIDTKGMHILDARAPGRFNGTDPEPRAELPSGHMPGSYNVQASGLLNPDGTLKSADDLMPILADHLGAPVVTTCGSGVSAAVISLALARLGHYDAAVYDGSWSEWAADPDSPIATK